ncbi:helix-turn-helix domain-containing protein [Lacunimicrobium album]
MTEPERLALIEAIARRVVELLRSEPVRTPDQLFLTANEVADRLGVKPTKVSGWCRSGKLPYINTGTPRKPRYKIDPRDIDRLKTTQAPIPDPYRAQPGHQKEIPSRY